jgi:hypothetical protein
VGERATARCIWPRDEFRPRQRPFFNALVGSEPETDGETRREEREQHGSDQGNYVALQVHTSPSVGTNASLHHPSSPRSSARGARVSSPGSGC